MEGVTRASADRTAAGAGRRRGILEIALVCSAALAYFGIRHLTEGDAAEAYAHAHREMRLERTLHLAWETSLQGLVLGHPLLVTLANWIYIWGHWPVLITVGAALFARRRERYLLLRNAMLLSGAIGFCFFALVPVAPPRLADPSSVDTVTLHSHSYRTLQPPALTNAYAAFPSLHFGWDLLAAIALWGATDSRALRALVVIVPAAMAAAVVLTANHYVLDVLGGLAVVLIALGLLRLGGKLPSRERLPSDWGGRAAGDSRGR